MKKIISMLLILMLMLSCAQAEPIGTRMKVVNCKEWITLRKSPDSKSDSLAQMNLGEENLILLGDGPDGFSKISYNGVIGYAMDKYLEAVESFTGEAITVDDDQRYGLNLFLSSFSKLNFAAETGWFNAADSEMSIALDFAVKYLASGASSAVKKGRWVKYDRRVSAEAVEACALDYFNMDLGGVSDPPYSLNNGFYYWTDDGYQADGGFVFIENVEMLDAKRIGVYFKICGTGREWSKSQLRMDAETINGIYACDYDGHAVINLGEGDLDDRNEWFLERYTVNKLI